MAYLRIWRYKSITALTMLRSFTIPSTSALPEPSLSPPHSPPAQTPPFRSRSEASSREDVTVYMCDRHDISSSSIGRTADVFAAHSDVVLLPAEFRTTDAAGSFGPREVFDD